MNVPVKLAGFAAALAAVFGLSFAAGTTVRPDDPPTDRPPATTTIPTPGHDHPD